MGDSNGLRPVVVTGGGSGIGASITLRLISEGRAVVATGRDESKLRELERRINAPDRLRTIVADSADWDDNQRAIALALETFGSVHAVVANAGFRTSGTFRTGDPTTWAPMVLTNVLGPIYLARAALTALEATKGHVVIIGSVAGHKNSPGNIYSATKWAMTGFAENLRMELASSGIGVTLVSPGIVNTPFYSEGPPGTPLSPDVISDAVVWVLNQPPGVDVNTLIIRPTGQPF